MWRALLGGYVRVVNSGAQRLDYSLNNESRLHTHAALFNLAPTTVGRCYNTALPLTEINGAM